MAEIAADRRSHPRARLRWKANAGAISVPDVVTARTQDVSLGGMRMRGGLDANPGDEVIVVLSTAGRTIPAMGTVVSAERHGEQTELRVEFRYMPAPAKNALREAIDASLARLAEDEPPQ